MTKKISKQERKRRVLLTLSVIGLIGAILAGIAAEQYYRLEICNFQSRDGESHGYYIYPFATSDSVLTLLSEDYDIANKHDLKIHSRWMLFQMAHAGYYKFPARFGDKHLIRRLQNGTQTPIHLSWTNQIRTREQLAGRLGHQLLLDSAEVSERLNDVAYMEQFGLNRETAVCLFLPNTYEVYWTITPDQLFERMNKEYRHFWTEERLHKADSIGLTPTEVATLASIVESETHRQAEHPTIAGLYLNRLRIGMKLQACPTVIFATGDLSMRRVLNRHLQLDSPYNTYKYPGLPPGPIRCPNGVTMDAVLNAVPSDYLYMCANPDWSGTHVFSSNYARHAEVARQYQRELNRRNIK